MKSIKEIFLKYKSIILYILFGILTTLVNIFVYFACSCLKFSTAASTLAAWIISVLFAYITNRKYVFGSKSQGAKSIFKEISNFFLSRFATGLLDLAVMLLFVDILNFNGMFIKVISNIVVIILNYVLSKFLVFKPSHKQ